jgi:hypothetical protein
MFVREDSRWLVKVLNHKKETKKIQVTYWLPKVSDKFDLYSTLKIKPLHSLDHAEQLPETPISAGDMEFEIVIEDNDTDVIVIEDNDTDVTNNFFARLLQQDN